MNESHACWEWSRVGEGTRVCERTKPVESYKEYE